MKHKSIRIADIQTSDVLYYDQLYEDICFRFCDERDIDCLPSLDDPHIIQIKDTKSRKFISETIAPDRTVNVHNPIFSSELLEKFRKNSLLLVYDGTELVGVVHFADYAKPGVSVYLYEIFFEYENALRTLLARKRFTNETMIEYFHQQIANNTGDTKDAYKRKVKEYQKRPASKAKLPPFQSFYLRDLMDLACANGIGVDVKDVNDLRNSIMHAHELVNKVDPSAGNLVYDFETFSRFFERSRQLLTDFSRVNNLLSFIEAEAPDVGPA